MRNCLIAGVLLVSLAPVAGAQWLNVRTPGIPRTADGKPMLDATVPRSADGRPDLSGLWQPASYTYLRNIMADMRPEDVPFQTWAAAVYETRQAKDDPAVRVSACRHSTLSEQPIQDRAVARSRHGALRRPYAIPGDRLVMHFPGNPDALSMFAESETRFFFTVRDEIIEFQSDPDGSVARLLIRSAKSEQVARKIR